jgi:PTS system nitrogen regulatory IIA component
MINLADLVTKDRVLLDLRSGSKRQLLQALADAAAQATGVESATILEALVQREKLGTTGLGEGIAIPHAKIPALAELTGFFVRLGKPVDFDALDGHPVDLVFLLLAPEAAGADHLKALARVARILRDQDLRRQIRDATTATEVSSLLSGRGDGATA